jgi:hypothetical protein
MGAVTLVQRFGSALNLDIHFHMLVPDGVYRKAVADGAIRFVAVPAPSSDELAVLVRTVTERIVSGLERAGLIARDIKMLVSQSTRAQREAPISTLSGHSITYRIATERLALTGGVHIRCTLETRHRDGTTHVIFEPMGLLAGLVDLVPKARDHATYD